MIFKHILLLKFVNVPELIFSHKVIWFHLFLSNTNNLLTINHLFAHSLMFSKYADSCRMNDNETMIKTHADFFTKIFTSHFICNV